MNESCVMNDNHFTNGSRLLVNNFCFTNNYRYKNTIGTNAIVVIAIVILAIVVLAIVVLAIAVLAIVVPAIDVLAIVVLTTTDALAMNAVAMNVSAIVIVLDIANVLVVPSFAFAFVTYVPL